MQILQSCMFKLHFVLCVAIFCLTIGLTSIVVQVQFTFITQTTRLVREQKQLHNEIRVFTFDKQPPASVCEDPACRDQLSNYDKLLYMSCVGKVKMFVGVRNPSDNGCRFFVTQSRKPVALISFPGSGNTWVRQLLESGSGICTGSTMCDISLRYDGFTGENINSGATLVVKTHRPIATWLTGPVRNTTGLVPNAADAAFESAIIIVRSPSDALVSEWNRIVANDFKLQTVHLHTHTKKVEEKNFGNNTRWNTFVENGCKKWQDTIQHWVIEGKNAGRKVLVVYYEDIKRDSKVQTKMMLDFLGMDMISTVRNSFSQFHRQHNSSEKAFDPFTQSQRQLVVSTIKNTMTEIERNNLSSTINLKSYTQKECEAGVYNLLKTQKVSDCPCYNESKPMINV